MIQEQKIFIILQTETIAKLSARLEETTEEMKKFVEEAKTDLTKQIRPLVDLLAKKQCRDPLLHLSREPVALLLRSQF